MSSSTIGGITGFVLVNSDVFVFGAEGVNDIAVTLTNLDGSAVTDASGAIVTSELTAQYGNFLPGYFVFSNIPDGEYAIELPPNATLASSTNGRELVSITSTSDGNYLAVDVNASFSQPIDVSAAIDGFVYVDSNQDGVQDNGEGAAAGQLIELANAGGTVVDVTTAAATGAFSFTKLTPGDYTISTPGINISQEPAGGVVAVATGQTISNATIGVYQHSISGFAFNDANGDGIQDHNETAFAGQTIELLNASGTVVAAATTNTQGNFNLVGLTPGTYTFSAAGGGVGAATNGETISLGAASVSNVTLAAYVGATISGVIFLDENDDGLFEVTPQGTDPDLGTGGIAIDFLNAKGQIAGTAISSFGGLFTSTPLAPGTYTIANSSVGIVSGGPSFHTITVTEGENLATAEIGIYEPNSIVVPSIFIDTNLDGTDDGAIDNLTASSTLPVTVTLLDQQGSIATDLAGHPQVQTFTSGVLQQQTQQFAPYTVVTPAVTFGNLAPGYYSVEVSAPGYQAEQGVYPVGSSLETAGLPEQPTTSLLPIPLYKIGSGITITGTVFAGTSQAGSPGLAGDTVSLVETNGSTPVIAQTVDTNANGQYSFTGLAPGNNYQIDFGTPLGYSATTPVFNVPVKGTNIPGAVTGPSAGFTLATATPPALLAASATLNIVLIGQSNAALFSGNGYLNLLAQTIEHDLGFNGTNQVVNLIVQPGPGDSASSNISSSPATEFGGTGLTTDWLTPLNGSAADGWTSGTNVDGVYSQMNAVLTYLAQTVASNPALSGEPTVILDLHNETDSQNPDLNTSIWMSALQFEASSIRAVLGDTPAQAPYVFVNAIPFPEEPIANASQAQVDETEQAIRLGMESLATDPAFNAIIGAQISDVDQNYQADDFGGWHLSSNSTINSAGQVIALQTNPQTGATYDDYVLEQRLALSLADEFSASALPGSPVANARTANSMPFDDTGPLVTGAATVIGSPNELLLTVKQFDALTGFNTTLSADAKAGVGWSIRTSATGSNSELVATATSATIISATQILVTFDAPVPESSSGDLLFYGWGGERIAPSSTPSSALGSDYNGTAYPGENAAIYDSNGEPIYTNAAGVIIASSQQTIANHLTVQLGQTLQAPLITTGTLELAVDASITGPISFSGTGGELVVDGSVPGNIITGFTTGNTIILDNFVVNTLDTTYGTGTGLELTDTLGNHITLDITGNFSTSSFLVVDPPGDTTITAVCYLRGTNILTPAGERPIETLHPGDTVITKFGGYQKIKWIGRQSFARRFIANNAAQIPVCIRQNALGPNAPKRDLFVSPGHSMLIDGVLVLAKSLLNGITIRQDDCPEQVDYFQLEFETHDCVLAEGVWSESYADTPDWRDKFHNAAEFYENFPNHVAPEIQTLCAQRPLQGPELARVLRPIALRAGIAVRPGDMRGVVDSVANGRITGWAQDQSYPLLPVQLEIWVAGRMRGHILACDERADLVTAGIGHGACAFDFTMPEACSILDLQVRRASDGARLPHTWTVCEAA